MAPADFQNLRVLALESRRAAEAAALIQTFGGQAIVAPALREVPLESCPAVLDFGAALLLGEIDVAVFLTGVGVRALIDRLSLLHSDIPAVLARVKVAARGPKPASVLRELKIPVWVVAPEPATWRELLAAIEARASEPIAGARIAIQEYGVPNEKLVQALEARGASILRVPIYRWALPDDLRPLQRAVADIAAGRVDVVLITSGVQIDHLWQVAEAMDCEAALRRGFESVFVASIGPAASEAIVRRGLTVHLQASRSRLGYLVREAAGLARAVAGREQGRTDLQKRGAGGIGPARESQRVVKTQAGPASTEL